MSLHADQWLKLDFKSLKHNFGIVQYTCSAEAYVCSSDLFGFISPRYAGFDVFHTATELGHMPLKSQFSSLKFMVLSWTCPVLCDSEVKMGLMWCT